jgi:YVTN family beta-propeller protein
MTLEADPPIAVGAEPWSVAFASSGMVVVANRAGGSLTLLTTGAHGTVETTAHVTVGPEPSAVVVSPDGDHAYVTLATEDTLVEVDLSTREVINAIALEAAPSAIAIVPSTDGRTVDSIVVTHLLARPLAGGGPGMNDGMQGVVSVVAPDLSSVDEHTLEPFEFGFPNVLTGVDVANGTAWVVHTLDRPEAPIGFNRMVSSALSAVPLGSDPTPPGTRLDLNDPLFSTPVNAPAGIVVTRDGLRAYLVLGGSDQLMGIDLSDPGDPRLLGFWPTGANPRGVALSDDGLTAYVMNYLSRDVSVLDLSDPRNRTAGTRVSVVNETLDAAMLLGKRLFFNASDGRLSTLGWMSCASCHPNGGSDGTTWHFPEGPRQTAPLWNLALRGPPFHASATRDELQDVQFDIEHLMRGQGLVPGATHPLLGTPNAGRSAELDALAAFIADGFRVPAAPRGDAPRGDATSVSDGEGDRARGRQVFDTAGCASCHGGPGWTRTAMPGPAGEVAGPGGEQVDAVLIDVGTYPVGQPGLGGDGFKAPTLLGLHATAPYLHNGSAPDLRAVLENAAHVETLAPHHATDLVAFLLSIDGRTEPFD